MRLIGYWISSLQDADYYPPQEFVADIAPDLRNTIADYLDAGQAFAVYRGMSWCRFFCDYPGGNRELSDGFWVWPDDLSHYVRDHSVMIPDEFVRHIESETPQMPKTPEWETHAPDTTFWKDWCRQHASGEYRGQLTAALQNADHEAERILDAAAMDLERATGTTSDICRWAGCNNNALTGKALCARCIINAETDIHVSHLYQNLRPILDA